MVTIDTVDAEDLDPDEVLALYGAVGWLAYTRDPGNLAVALRGSATVVAARDGRALVGLARVVSDNASICYLQDILVLPSYQGRGIGRGLAERALEPYAHVRQKVLITDDEPRQAAFYEALGYTRTDEFRGGAVRAFIRFD